MERAPRGPGAGTVGPSSTGAPSLARPGEDAAPAGRGSRPAIDARAEGPEIEVRAPAADAALRRARAAADAQMAVVVSERDRLLTEARITREEQDRLGAMLEAAAEERERLSADLDRARASLADIDLSGPQSRRGRVEPRRRRHLWVPALALAGGTALLAAGYASRPVHIEVNGAPPTLLDRTETAHLVATRRLRLGLGRPADGVVWSSADPRVATVDAQGVVTPVGTGSTRVEAREGGLASSVEVTVSLPARIAVAPAALILIPESPAAAVEASVLDASGAPWKKRAELTWTSSDAGVATVADGAVQRRGPGDAVITVSLGELHGRISVRSLDRRTALEQACDAGALDRCVALGLLVEKGEDLPADGARALALYEKACAAGALEGCVAAGESLEGGRAGTPDVKKALAAYQKACDGKAAPGCSRLGRLYETTVRDLGRALGAYRAACDALDLEGCWRLGAMYEHGSGLGRDPGIAVDLYTRACDGGRPPACTSLAHMYWNGSGAVARDQPGALGLFEKACEGRNEEACVFLALAYKAGDGVVGDPKKALGYFGKACAAGHKGSCGIAARGGP